MKRIREKERGWEAEKDGSESDWGRESGVLQRKEVEEGRVGGGVTVEEDRCGFPLAKERKKRKTFFSHTAGSLGTGVRGVLDPMACVRNSVFVLPSAIA